MYVCLCNAITDIQLERLAKQGHSEAETAYAALDAKVCCGRCLPTAKSILKQHSTETGAAPDSYAIAAE